MIRFRLSLLALGLLALATVNAATPLFTAPVERPDWTTVRGLATPDASQLHDGKKSLRVEAGTSPDARVQSPPVSLTIGKTYELTGWVRTEGLTVQDLDRSPIAIGAALSMASMPFDVHSVSVGGTQGWTRLSLRFVASRAQDQILLTAGSGGAFRGKAWFEGVSLDEASPGDSWPARDAVRTFGPAYRYPAAGWIYLHIEGKPYERGYQHGYPDGERNSRVSDALRVRSRRQGRCADLERLSAPPRMRCSCAASTRKFWRRCAALPTARTPPARNGWAASSIWSISFWRIPKWSWANYRALCR